MARRRGNLPLASVGNRRSPSAQCVLFEKAHVQTGVLGSPALAMKSEGMPLAIALRQYSGASHRRAATASHPAEATTPARR